MKLPYFPKASFQTKLIIAMALMLLLIVAGAVSSIYLVQPINSALHKVVDVSLYDFKAIAELQKMTIHIEEPVHHYLLYGDTEERETLAGLVQQIELTFSRVQIRSTSLEEQELLFQSRRQWQKVSNAAKEIMTLEPNRPEATASKMVSFHQDESLLANLLERLHDLLLEDAYEQERKAVAVAADMLNLAIMASVAGVVIAAIATVLLIYSVLTPIRRLKQGAEHFGRGDLTHRVPVVSRDEFGELAKAFNAMAEQLEKDQAMLEEMATHDGLTGLYNHREFQRLLQAELERSQRYKHPLSLLMLDIDHFKRVNDTYGHQSGDMVLRTLADQLRNGIRKVDYAARYGGEEFAIVLPEMIASDALLVAERLRQSIAAQPVTIEQGQIITITISIGVATFPDDADSKDKLIAAADKALYAAKAAGRNRVLRAV